MNGARICAIEGKRDDGCLFLSYARNDRNKYSKLKAVIDHLDHRVSELRAMTPPVVFFDENSIETGEQWERAISRAAHESQVLVCMLSASYISSEWCAKEFDVFRRRVVAAGSDARVAIIPVIWDIREDQIPSALRAYQYKNSATPDVYLAEGLRSLRALKKRRDAYITTIEHLAQTIAKAAQRLLPALSPPVESRRCLAPSTTQDSIVLPFARCTRMARNGGSIRVERRRLAGSWTR